MLVIDMNAIQRLISETECGGTNCPEEAREVQIGQEVKTLLAAIKAQGDQADPVSKIEKLIDELIAMHEPGGVEAPCVAGAAAEVPALAAAPTP